VASPAHHLRLLGDPMIRPRYKRACRPPQVGENLNAICMFISGKKCDGLVAVSVGAPSLWLRMMNNEWLGQKLGGLEFRVLSSHSIRNALGSDEADGAMCDLENHLAGKSRAARCVPLVHPSCTLVLGEHQGALRRTADLTACPCRASPRAALRPRVDLDLCVTNARSANRGKTRPRPCCRRADASLVPPAASG